MTVIRENHFSMLVCLMSLEDGAADRSALQLAKLFGSRCRALLIEDQDRTTVSSAEHSLSTGTERRTRNLTYLGQEMGLTIDVDVSGLSPGVQRIRAQPEHAMTILMQPAHPLLRQTHTFQSVKIAAAEAPGATLYAPPSHGLERGDILVLSNQAESSALNLAKQLSDDTQRGVERFNVEAAPPASLISLVKALTLRMSHDAHALFVMLQGEFLQDASAYSSRAAGRETPILVVEAMADNAG